MANSASGGRGRRTGCGVWGAIGWAALVALSAGPTGAFDLASAQRFQLDNGLTVIVLEVPEAPVVSVQALYRVGARNEEVGQTGVTHFLEHMAFRASEQLPRHWAREFDLRGGWRVARLYVARPDHLLRDPARRIPRSGFEDRGGSDGLAADPGG